MTRDKFHTFRRHREETEQSAVVAAMLLAECLTVVAVYFARRQRPA